MTSLVPALPVPAAPLPARLREILNDLAGVDDLERVVQRWEAGLAPESQRAYRLAIKQLAVWMEATSPEHALASLCALDQSTAEIVLEQWVQHLTAGGAAPNTIALALVAVLSFIGVARRAGLVSWGKLKIRRPRADGVRDSRGPGQAVVARMLAAVDGTTPMGRRDAAILALLADHALRRTEVARLVRTDVVEEQGVPAHLTISGKGSRLDEVRLSGRASMALRAWLADRDATPDAATLLCAVAPNGALDELGKRKLDERDKKGQGRLFGRFSDRGRCTLRGPMTSKAIEGTVQRLAGAAGIPQFTYDKGQRRPVVGRQRVAPHGIRHTTLTLVATGRGLHAAQVVARHQSPATTARYLDNRAEVRDEAIEFVSALYRA